MTDFPGYFTAERAYRDTPDSGEDDAERDEDFEYEVERDILDRLREELARERETHEGAD